MSTGLFVRQIKHASLETGPRSALIIWTKLS